MKSTKITKYLSIGLALLIGGIVLLSCEGGPRVTYYVNQELVDTRNFDPEKDDLNIPYSVPGHVWYGWHKDQALTIKHNFNDLIETRTSLYGKSLSYADAMSEYIDLAGQEGFLLIDESNSLYLNNTTSDSLVVSFVEEASGSSFDYTWDIVSGIGRFVRVFPQGSLYVTYDLKFVATYTLSPSFTNFDSFTTSSYSAKSSNGVDLGNMGEDSFTELAQGITTFAAQAVGTNLYAINKYASDLPSVSFRSATMTLDSVAFSISISDEMGYGSIKSIEIFHGDSTSSYDLIDSLSNLSLRQFNNLLSNNQYTLRVGYGYNMHDGNGNRTLYDVKSFKTNQAITPTIDFKNVTSNKTTVFFDYNYYDPMAIGVVAKIQLFKNGQFIKETTDITTRSFTNLLSDTTYTVKIVANYDMKDGVGQRQLEKNIAIKTYAKQTPAMEVTNLSATYDYIDFSVSISDSDNTGSIKKIELLKGGSIVATASSTSQRRFTNLQSGQSYNVKVTYEYDLNDGYNRRSIYASNSISTIAKTVPPSS